MRQHSQQHSEAIGNRSIARSAKLFIALAAALTLTAPGNLHANQVFKACGKKWVAKAKKLEAAKLGWMLQKRNAEMNADLDRDGRSDVLTVESNPNFRSCDLKKAWDQKETTVRIELATGKTLVYHWIGTGLVHQLKVFPELERILVAGLDAQGVQVARWVQYRTVEEVPEIDTMLADAADPVRIASIMR